MKSALIAAGLLTAANGGTAVEDPLQIKQRCVIEIHDGDHADHEAGDHNHHGGGAFFVNGTGEDGSPTWTTEDGHVIVIGEDGLIEGDVDWIEAEEIDGGYVLKVDTGKLKAGKLNGDDEDGDESQAGDESDEGCCQVKVLRLPHGSWSGWRNHDKQLKELSNRVRILGAKDLKRALELRSLADKSPRVLQPDVYRRLYQSRERAEADREKRSLEERVRELERIIEEMRASDGGKDRGVSAPRSSREKATREELEKTASSLLRSALAAHGQDPAGDALAADLHAMVAQMREQVRSLREDLHELRQDISAYGSGGVER